MIPDEKEEALIDRLKHVGKITKNVNRPQASWRLYLSAFTADLLLVTFGTTVAWPSAIIPKLTSNNTDINPLGSPITTLQISIIVSSPCFAIIFASCVTAKLVDIIGRKRMLQLCSICLIVTMTVIAFSKHLYAFYACQILNGCIISAVLVTVPVYNNEIASDENRSWLSCAVSLGLPLGVLLSYIFGAVITSFGLFTLTSVVPSLLHLALSYALVESPMYLASKCRKREGLIALKKLRNYKNSEDVEIEYKDIQDISTNYVQQKASVFDIFKSSNSRKALFISFLVTFTQQISGISIILPYMGPIFNEAGAALSANEVSILTGCIQLLVVILVTFIVSKFGKRPLLLISSLLCSVSVIGIGLYFYMKNIESPIHYEIRWLPVLCVISFIISYGLGLGSIPLGYNGELFKQELRTTGVSLAMFFGGVLIFLLDFGFPLLAETYGIHVCMFAYGLATFTGFIFLLLFLPETRGESLKGIQKIIERKTLHIRTCKK